MSDLAPENWKPGVLGDFAEINPKLDQRAYLTDETSVSFIRMEDVTNSAFIKNLRTVHYREVCKGFTTFQNHDVLLAKITPCFENGKGAHVEQLVSGVGFGSTEFHVLRARENSDSRFLYQYTNYPAFRMSGEVNMTGSAGQRRVPTEFLRTHPVFFPPISQQKKIATILSSVDTVIRKSRAEIDKLEDLKTGMMQELLTKGIGHSEFKDSPLGQIPVGWEVTTVERLLIGTQYSMRSGPFGSALLKKELIDRGIPLLGIDNVHVERFQNSFKRFVTEEKFRELSKYAVYPGDVMVTIMGTVGRSCVVPEGIGDALSSKHVWTMTLDHRRYLPDLLCWQINSADWVGRQFKRGSQGGVMDSISSTALKKLVVPVPSIEEQSQIRRIYFSLTERIENMESKLLCLQSLKKALMQDLLTGKVRVKVEENDGEPATA